MYFGTHMVFKHDVYDSMVEFITIMRKDDRFGWMNYPFAVEFIGDRDPQWLNSKEWHSKVTTKLNIRLRASDPSDKNSNSLPELANKEMERRTKS